MRSVRGDRDGAGTGSGFPLPVRRHTLRCRPLKTALQRAAARRLAPLRQARAFFCKKAGLPVLLGAWLAAGARAQEAPRPSLARQRVEQPLPTESNVKVGPILFRFSAGLRSEWVDNVSLANGKTTPVESDFLFNPQLGIEAVWPATKLNVLRFHTTLGLTKYLSHSALNTNDLLVSPDSELRWQVYVGDFRVDLHDQFSYQQDPVGQGQLSNVARFGRWVNTAGLGVLWDANDVTLSVGYDHTTFLVTGATTASPSVATSANAQDRTTDQVAGSAALLLTGALNVGLESVASRTRYPEAPQDDASRVSVGPYLQLLLTHYTRIYAAAGYQGTFFDNPTPTATTATAGTVAATSLPRTTAASPDSYYANLTITHRLNRYYQDKLSVGHDSQIGLFAQSLETTYVNYSSILQLSPRFDLSTSVFYEDTVETGSTGTLPYRRFGLALSTGCRLTKKLSATVSYQFTERTSDNEAQSYRQNRVGLMFTYQF